MPDPRRRPFRFGAVTTSGTEHARGHSSDYARRLESLGFARLFVADHYLNSTVCTPWHPVLLAREAAEIDLLSSGRMELGMGAGWAKDEYDAVGVSTRARSPNHGAALWPSALTPAAPASTV